MKTERHPEAWQGMQEAWQGHNHLCLQELRGWEPRVRIMHRSLQAAGQVQLQGCNRQLPPTCPGRQSCNYGSWLHQRGGGSPRRARAQKQRGSEQNLEAGGGLVKEVKLRPAVRQAKGLSYWAQGIHFGARAGSHGAFPARTGTTAQLDVSS